MLMPDPNILLATHMNDLLEEAERNRLAAKLPHRAPHPLRLGLASICQRLANWLDKPVEYLQSPDSGLEDWEVPWARV